jgi:carboxyl-terminal processing protease
MMRKTSLLFLGAMAGAAMTIVVTQPHVIFNGSSAKAAASDTYRQLNLFGDVFERVRADYVDKPDDSKLVEAAINGMLAGLDPHSSYMDPKSFRDMQVQTRGEFGGLGIEVTMEDGLIKVVAPIDETPAAKAGVMANDIITRLDDDAVQGMTLNQAVDKMRGPVNTKIRLTIMRKGVEKPLELTIVRDIIRVKSVRSHPEGADVGYIRITQFNEQTTDGLKQSITDLKNQLGADKIKGYVLDLRNNPGGLLDQAISVSNAFLDKGEIVSTRGRNADETQRFNARPGGDLTGGKPLIILINGGSASASEIVAGALQDHKRATLIGTRSFGKGSVQTIIPLGAGNGALRLTTARYYTPSGRTIQAKGITPDIEVLQDVPEELKARTDSRGEASLPGHLKAEGAEQSGSQSYVPPDEKDDRALKAAIDRLHGNAIVADVGTAGRTDAGAAGDQPKATEHPATPDVATAKPAGDQPVQGQKTLEEQLKTAEQQRIADVAAAKQTEDQAVQRQKALEQQLKAAEQQRVADVTAAKQTENQAVQRQKALEQQLKAAEQQRSSDAAATRRRLRYLEAENARLRKLVAGLDRSRR